MKGKMKAQVFYEAGKMRMEEIDVPQISDREVLIKVKACGICGSDISYYYGHSPLDTPNGKGPLVLGHEFSGDVVEMGSEVKRLGLLGVGDRVTCNPVQPCNSCVYCKKGMFNLCKQSRVPGVSVNGALAEYVKVDYTNVFKLGNAVSYEYGAMTEPLACATHGITTLDIELGDTVVVIGPGAIGLMMVQLAKARGAGRVVLVGIFDYPLQVGLACGADVVLNSGDKKSQYYCEDVPAKIAELTNGLMAQKVIVPTNAMPALQSALDVSSGGSTIVYFGLPGERDVLEIPVLEAIQSSRTIKFSWLTGQIWPNVINALDANMIDLGPLITHRFSLADAGKGIEFMRESQEDKIKGVICIG